MTAATVGEVVSMTDFRIMFQSNLQVTAVVRVPFEIVKQRAQANLHLTPFKILRHTLQTQVQ